VNEVFFEGHPYAVAPEGTTETLAGIDLDAVEAWYGTAFSANRMFVVAVGDFEPDSLRRELEAGVGTIPDRAFPLPRPAPAFDYGSGISTLTKREFPQSKGIAYLRGDFAAPGPEDKDFMALNIGMKMFADLLLNVVRDKYGAVYSPGAYIRDSLANYGSITMYKTKAAGKIKSYIDEAAADLARGMVLSVDPTVSDGARPRMSVEEALPAYKAKYANALFQGQSTNAQVASRIAKSVISAGDCRAWLLDFDRIESVTAVELRAAIAKYVAGGRIDWVVLGSADAILPAVDVDYEVWTSQ
jgi:zinc protease